MVEILRVGFGYANGRVQIYDGRSGGGSGEISPPAVGPDSCGELLHPSTVAALTDTVRPPAVRTLQISAERSPR